MDIQSDKRQGAMLATTRNTIAALCVGAVAIAVGHSVSGQGGGSDPSKPEPTDRAKIIPQPPMDTSTKPWTGARTPDGQPDIQGYWRIPNAGTRSVENVGDNHFTAAGLAPLTNQSSRVVDPPDGRLPIQPWALERVRQQTRDLHNTTEPWHVDAQARCVNGPPRWQYYVSEFLVTQVPGMVVLTHVSYHMSRVIRLDVDEHLVAPDVKLWFGDSIGYWDGNTLNVDLANVNGKIRVDQKGNFVTDDVHIQERFVVMGPGNMIWEQTITDPNVYTRPFTMRVPVVQEGYHYISPTDEMWEYECWESQEVRPSLMPAYDPGQAHERP